MRNTLFLICFVTVSLFAEEPGEPAGQAVDSGSTSLPPAGAKSEILEKNRHEKHTSFFGRSATQMVFFEKQSGFNPLDSAENYRLVRDQYQSFTGFLRKRNGRSEHGLYAGADMWSEDTSDYKVHARIPTLNYHWKNYWKLDYIVIGRQNSNSGFHYYKLDGLSGSLKLTRHSGLSGYFGNRVDTSWNMDTKLESKSGYISYNQDLGHRSKFFIGYERASLDGRLNANDVGYGITYRAGKNISLRSRSRMSWDGKLQLTETRNRVRYRLSRKHSVYTGYNYFDPLFRDTLQAYYFDVFDYNKTYLGWDWRPLKKKDMYVKAEGSVLGIDEFRVFHARLGFVSRFFDLTYIQRFGDLSGAAVAIARVKAPVHRTLTAGTGVDYANMDLYYEGSRDFYSYYGYCRYQPFKTVTALLRAENRQSLFVEKDIRVVGNLTVSFASEKGRYFVWED
ncbi:hypothetical protein ACFL5V_07600 [Fibrobacterota bacterium]